MLSCDQGLKEKRKQYLHGLTNISIVYYWPLFSWLISSLFIGLCNLNNRPSFIITRPFIELEHFFFSQCDLRIFYTIHSDMHIFWFYTTTVVFNDRNKNLMVFYFNPKYFKHKFLNFLR